MKKNQIIAFVMVIVAFSSCQKSKKEETEKEAFCPEFTTTCETLKKVQIFLITNEPDTNFIDGRGHHLQFGKWYYKTLSGIFPVIEDSSFKIKFKEFEDNNVHKIFDLLEYKNDIKLSEDFLIWCEIIPHTKTFTRLYKQVKVKMLLTGPRQVSIDDGIYYIDDIPQF